MVVYKKYCHIKALLFIKCTDLLKGGGLELLITKETFNRLINCPRVPPEIGGILMGNSSIIDTVIFDSGIRAPSSSGIKYVPGQRQGRVPAGV